MATASPRSGTSCTRTACNRGDRASQPSRRSSICSASLPALHPLPPPQARPRLPRRRRHGKGAVALSCDDPYGAAHACACARMLRIGALPSPHEGEASTPRACTSDKAGTGCMAMCMSSRLSLGCLYSSTGFIVYVSEHEVSRAVSSASLGLQVIATRLRLHESVRFSRVLIRSCVGALVCVWPCVRA